MLELAEPPVADAEAVFSLRRSRVRREVLSFLARIHPRASYPSEIARAINARADQVLAALRGYGTRYRRDISLLGLGLVREVGRGPKLTLYAATEKGVRVVAYLNMVEYNLSQ